MSIIYIKKCFQVQKSISENDLFTLRNCIIKCSQSIVKNLNLYITLRFVIFYYKSILNNMLII